MKINWLNKNNNSKLIVFFNGWGMDEKVVKHLSYNDYDVLAICDYNEIKPIDFDFSKYSEKSLICWSMGVFIANLFYEQFNEFDNIIAINGTQKPIDDNFGIPKNIYNLMIDNFNEQTVSRFIKKMTLSDVLSDFQTRNNDELKQELISIKRLKPNKYLTFDKVIVSTKDRIIPYKNQLNYWQTTNSTIIEKDLPHYIFDKYKNWSELL